MIYTHVLNRGGMAVLSHVDDPGSATAPAVGLATLQGGNTNMIKTLTVFSRPNPSGYTELRQS